MKSAHSADVRSELVERVNRLEPGTPAKWGKFTAPRMVCHLSDSLRMAIGDLDVASKNLPVRFFPLKQLLIYMVPMAKGLPTAPELIARTTDAWAGELEEFATLLATFARHPQSAPWPDHPAFGRMSRNDWGVLVYRHSDHHLRQFGV